MNGRIEIDNSKEKKTLNVLKSLPSFVNDWYLNMLASGFTQSTCYDYVSIISRFIRHINSDSTSVQLKDITHSNVAQFLKDAQKRTLKDGTVKMVSGSANQNNWLAVKNLCDFLVSSNQIKDNPITSIKKPKSKDLDRITRERILLTKEDFDKILKCVKHRSYYTRDKIGLEIRDYAIMILFMSTGIRLSALRSIDISDVNLPEKKISFIDKGMVEHVWELSDICVDALSDWLEIRSLYKNNKGNETALFISSRGDRISETSTEALVRKYSHEALGYTISPHKLRAGFISVMYDIYGDVEKVRRMVGHKNIATTTRYIVTNGNEKKEAADAFDVMFGKPKSSVHTNQQS